MKDKAVTPARSNHKLSLVVSVATEMFVKSGDCMVEKERFSLAS